MKIIKNLILFLITLLVTGCVKEDMTVCGVEITFKYDYNMDEIDKFSTEIERIDLFLFDEDGLYMGYYVSDGPFDTDFRIHLDMPAGTYSFVAWGGYNEDRFFISDLHEGLTTLQEAQLIFTSHSKDGVVETSPGSLFYGSRLGVETKALGTEVLISMIKDTNSIQTVFNGLPISPETNDNFVLRIEAENREYSFENKLLRQQKLTYMPVLATDYGQKHHSGEFATMRVLGQNSDTPCNSRVILEYHSDGNDPSGRAAGQVMEIMNVSLAQVIEYQYNRLIDFDRQDEFTIEFDFDGDISFTNFTIHVNGWKVADQGDITFW